MMLRIICFLLFFLSGNTWALSEWITDYDGNSLDPSVLSVSDNGRYILLNTERVLTVDDRYEKQVGFVNALVGATPGYIGKPASDAYLYDRNRRQYELLSVDSTGRQLQQETRAIGMSSDARFVLMSGGYLRDRTGAIATTTSVPWSWDTDKVFYQYWLLKNGSGIIRKTESDAGLNQDGYHIFETSEWTIYDIASGNTSPLLETNPPLLPKQDLVWSRNGRYVFFVGGLNDPSATLVRSSIKTGYYFEEGMFYRYDRLSNTLDKLDLPTDGLNLIGRQVPEWIADDGQSVIYYIVSTKYDTQGQKRLIRYDFNKANIVALLRDQPEGNISDDGWYVINNINVTGSYFQQLAIQDLQYGQTVILSVDQKGKPLQMHPALLDPAYSVFPSDLHDSATQLNARLGAVIGGGYRLADIVNAPSLGAQQTKHLLYTEPEPSEAALSQTGEPLLTSVQSGDRWSAVFTVTAQGDTRETWLRLPLSENWMLEAWPSSCVVNTRWLDCRAGSLGAGSTRDFPVTIAFYHPGSFRMQAQLYQSGIDRTSPDDLVWSAAVTVKSHPQHAWLDKRPWIEATGGRDRQVGTVYQPITADDLELYQVLGFPVYAEDALNIAHTALRSVSGEQPLARHFWQDTTGRISDAESTLKQTAHYQPGLAIRPVLELRHADGSNERFYGRFSAAVIDTTIVHGTVSAGGGSPDNSGSTEAAAAAGTLVPGPAAADRQASGGEARPVVSKDAQHGGGAGLLLAILLMMHMLLRRTHAGKF